MAHIVDYPVVTSVGPNEKIQLSGDGYVTWVQFYAPDSNTDVVFVGGTGVEAGVGIPISPGGAMLISQRFQLSTMYLFFLDADNHIYLLPYKEAP